MPHSPLDDLLPGLSLKEPQIQHLKDLSLKEYDVNIDMLRLDEIHPVISGNKIFKLYYFLKEAIASGDKNIITFGGAYSNHLAATAFACREMQLKCTGYVRGEETKSLSPTLLFCKENGMRLKFLSRHDFKKIREPGFINEVIKTEKPHILVPEGGYSKEGAKGAEEIKRYFNIDGYTQICVAVGTATTFAGLIRAAGTHCEVAGFSVLKNLNDIEKRLQELEISRSAKYTFLPDYHFGGYAKKSDKLIAFINDFYDKHKVPLDFVYTGKMMYGVYDLLKRNYFKTGSRILCIHSGGLQGNQSLKKGTLHF